jgi:hypothetical protein
MRYTQCVRCCIDTTVPGAVFDGAGVCSYCHLHDRMEQDFPPGHGGSRRWKESLPGCARPAGASVMTAWSA